MTGKSNHIKRAAAAVAAAFLLVTAFASSASAAASFESTQEQESARTENAAQETAQVALPESISGRTQDPSENDTQQDAKKITSEQSAAEETAEEETTESPAMAKAMSASDQEDTTWQNDFLFEQDETEGVITLRQYKGNLTELVIPSKAVISGSTYKVIIGNNGNSDQLRSAFAGTGVKRLTFEPGVVAADEPYLFCSAPFEFLDVAGLDTSHMTTMKEMFSLCGNLKELHLDGMDTSHVTDMSYMFSGLTSLESVDVSMLDLSLVTNLEMWFGDDESLSSVNVSGLKTPSLVSCADMFKDCSRLSHIDVSSFDFGGVSQPLDRWTVFKHCGLESVTLNHTVLIPSNYKKGDDSSALYCWNTHKDGSGKQYFQGQYCTEKGAVTLYAQPRVKTEYTAEGANGYMLYKDSDPDSKECVYCLNRYLFLPKKNRFALVDAKTYGGFTERQKLMLAAAILMQDHADGASIQHVIWRITDHNGGGSQTSGKDKAYYQYISDHCEELAGIYEMNFYLSSDGAVQNLLSAQQVRIPTSLKIIKKVENDDTADGDADRLYSMQVSLRDSGNNPLSGTYYWSKEGESGTLTADSEGRCSVSVQAGQYVVIRNLPVGTKYTVEEAPDSAKGFTVSYENAQGTIAGNSAGIVTVTNTKPEYDVEISKQDIAGEEIEGASLEITHEENGEPVTDDRWVSQKDKTHTTKLRPGNYVLHESGAPDGFVAASDIPFTVTQEGKVTVEGEAVDKVVMTDVYETGSLTVKKTVEGNLGDRSEKFDFTIRLLRDGKPVSGEFPTADQKTVSFDENGEAGFTLSHGEKVTIEGIRTGTNYVVVEESANENGYLTSSVGADGTIVREGSTASYTNTREGTVPTGADTGRTAGFKAGAAALIFLAIFAGRKIFLRYVTE